ncbi:MAG: V-type ATP synthase subunit F [Candidatus Bathyarchaeia archaeon]
MLKTGSMLQQWASQLGWGWSQLATIAIIADKHLAAGFRLAGVESYPVKNVEEARELLLKLASEGEHDVVILTERLSEELRRERLKILSMSRGKPVLAVIPDFQGPRGKRRRELHELVSESVGAELKFEG